EVCGRTTRPTGASFAHRRDTPKITNLALRGRSTHQTILERPWPGRTGWRPRFTSFALLLPTPGSARSESLPGFLEELATLGFRELPAAEE
ncbi:MAG: hypothetical protein ACRDTA_06600, partial [Pseudonocardiaceae bacterium]